MSWYEYDSLIIASALAIIFTIATALNEVISNSEVCIRIRMPLGTRNLSQKDCFRNAFVTPGVNDSGGNTQ